MVEKAEGPANHRFPFFRRCGLAWNYRLMRHTNEHVYWYAIHEVFYDDDGYEYAWTEDEITPVADDKEEMIKVLKMMLRDVKRSPVMDYDAKPRGKAPWLENDVG